ncbi:NADPH-dependent ferric siderophore reductase, contains FAD-binding and SIP domains [Pseudovibrio denitrificans]|uniref:NADPH-dependent ferric siderophore reductase, contains FAD-binding and SIP domains n=1 Tax=Pseudovibrio denitrificans TaxID=258256 RepID=A0A1I7DU00_9HYPH|nr:siderophore-interacting protein [Pseudovibrio denitrificans]SFU15135.1 NADPH-dependent ferric siderophore reductase, contains FAD-binding and SIP domains [Pseudovibrio denitrificans]
MTTTAAELHKIESLIPGIEFDKAIELFGTEAKLHNLTLEEITGKHYRVNSPFGMVEFVKVDAQAKLMISAPSQDALHLVKESIEHLIGHIDINIPPQMVWCGDFTAGVHPPNFLEVRVVRTAAFSSNFIRVTVSAKGIERFFEGGLHFRLLFPKNSSFEARWPYWNDKGRTVWPEGDYELMRPVYTVRQFDKAVQSIDFDVFLHEGGPTADWAARVIEGDTVGLLGPGGGWIPEANYLLLAGDETAIPAISRILESSPEGTKCAVVISVSKKGMETPIPLQDGMSLEWVYRDAVGHDGLFEAAKQIEIPNVQEAFCWFAAEKKTAKKARKHFRNEVGFKADNCYIAGFWEEE